MWEDLGANNRRLYVISRAHGGIVFAREESTDASHARVHAERRRVRRYVGLRARNKQHFRPISAILSILTSRQLSSPSSVASLVRALRKEKGNPFPPNAAFAPYAKFCALGTRSRDSHLIEVESIRVVQTLCRDADNTSARISAVSSSLCCLYAFFSLSPSFYFLLPSIHIFAYVFVCVYVCTRMSPNYVHLFAERIQSVLFDEF